MVQKKAYISGIHGRRCFTMILAMQKVYEIGFSFLIHDRSRLIQTYQTTGQGTPLKSSDDFHGVQSSKSAGGFSKLNKREPLKGLSIRTSKEVVLKVE